MKMANATPMFVTFKMYIIMWETYELFLEIGLQAVIKLFNLDSFHAAGYKDEDLAVPLWLPLQLSGLPDFRMKPNILS